MQIDDSRQKRMELSEEQVRRKKHVTGDARQGRLGHKGGGGKPGEFNRELDSKFLSKVSKPDGS